MQTFPRKREYGNFRHQAKIDCIQENPNPKWNGIGKELLGMVHWNHGHNRYDTEEGWDKRNATAGVLHRLRFSRKNPLCKFKFKTFTLEWHGEWFYAALQSFCVIKKIFLIKIKTWLHTFLTKLIDIFWNYWYIECQIVSCYDT